MLQSGVDLRCRRDREKQAVRAAFVALTGVPGRASPVSEDVDIDLEPAEPTPEDGLGDPKPLDAVGRHGLAGEVGEATGDPQPLRRSREREVELTEDALADKRSDAQCHRDDARQHVGEDVEAQADDHSGHCEHQWNERGG